MVGQLGNTAGNQTVPRLHSATFTVGEVDDAYEIVGNGSATGQSDGAAE